MDNAWHSSLLEHHPDAIYVLIDDCVAYANPAGVDLMKACNLEQLLGLKPEVFLIPVHHETVKQLLENSNPDNPPSSLRFQCIRLDGLSIDIDVHSKAFQHDSNIAILLSVREVPLASSKSAQIIRLPENDAVKLKANRIHEALHHEKEILEMIALDKPISHILEDVCDRMNACWQTDQCVPSAYSIKVHRH